MSPAYLTRRQLVPPGPRCPASYRPLPPLAQPQVGNPPALQSSSQPADQPTSRPAHQLQHQLVRLVLCAGSQLYNVSRSAPLSKHSQFGSLKRTKVKTKQTNCSTFIPNKIRSVCSCPVSAFYRDCPEYSWSREGRPAAAVGVSRLS